MSYKKFYEDVESRNPEEYIATSPVAFQRYAWSIRTGRTVSMVSELIRSFRRYPIVLDVGCAGMWLHEYLLEKRVSHRYVGCDISFSYQRKSSDTPFCSRVVCDAACMPFKTDCADITTSFEVIEHLPDPKAAAREIQRTANSFVVVSVPMIGTPLFGLDQHRFDRFAESVEIKIRSFLDRVGWDRGLRVLEKRIGAAHVSIFTYSRFLRLFSSKHSCLKARGALFYFPRLSSILENPVTRCLYLILEKVLLSRLPIFVVRVSWLPFKPLGNRYGILVLCRAKAPTESTPLC